MRENMGLYRGKRKDNGEWIEGSLLKVTISGETYYFIFCDDFALDGFDVKALSRAIVDPETIGEYTGLPDKTDKLIFEGDIVRTERDLWSGETKKEREEFVSVVRYDNKLCSFGLSGKYKHLPLNRFKGDYNEVIGSIHDNPELLEVSGDE